jgi:hypothetical protein
MSANKSTAEKPKCPKGIIQWQHGSYEKGANGALTLNPIKVDGRQMYSDPCQYKTSVYTRYNVTMKFKVRQRRHTIRCLVRMVLTPIKTYQVYTDTYRNKMRLDLFQADGAPLQPLWLVYNPPKMLPTQTLNPLVTATPATGGKVKRGDLPLNHEVLFKRTDGKVRADQWWWFGVMLTASGGFLWYFF